MHWGFVPQVEAVGHISENTDSHCESCWPTVFFPLTPTAVLFLACDSIRGMNIEDQTLLLNTLHDNISYVFPSFGNFIFNTFHDMQAFYCHTSQMLWTQYVIKNQSLYWAFICHFSVVSENRSESVRKKNIVLLWKADFKLLAVRFSNVLTADHWNQLFSFEILTATPTIFTSEFPLISANICNFVKSGAFLASTPYNLLGVYLF